jgi:hypothetical protein
MLGVATVLRGSRRSGFLVEQDRAALGDHHRVDHHRDLAEVSERIDHRLDRIDAPQHPDLHRVDPDVLGDHSHLGDDHPRRDGFDRLDPDRVLGGDRGDRRHPVHAAAGKRLQIRLNPSATT